MLMTPVVLMPACRLFAASAALSWLSVEIWPAPVPKVMLVAVPPPVAPMVSVWPLSGGGTTAVVPAERPSAASALPEPPSTRFWAVPVLSTSLPPETLEAVDAPVMLSIAARTSLTFSVLPTPMPIVTLPKASVVELVCAVEKLMVLPSTVRTEPLVIPGLGGRWTWSSRYRAVGSQR